MLIVMQVQCWKNLGIIKDIKELITSNDTKVNKCAISLPNLGHQHMTLGHLTFCCSACLILIFNRSNVNYSQVPMLL